MKYNTLLILASAVFASQAQIIDINLSKRDGKAVNENTPDKTGENTSLNWVESKDGVACTTFKNKAFKDIPEECLWSVLCIDEAPTTHHDCPPVNLSFNKKELVNLKLKRECISQILCEAEPAEEKPFVAPTEIPEISNFRGFWGDDE